METVKLGQRQIFGVKKDTLMKRIVQYFEQTKNAAQVVEYLVAILLRDALCVGDYSLDQLTDLIHQIFLTTEPNDTLRKQSVFFQSFFSNEEWQNVVDRLFQNEAEYREFTKETCLYREFLQKKHREVAEISEFQYNIVSIFKDANGKRHTWTLRDTKKIGSESETAEVLKILTTLTIFQHAGVRRFAEYVKYKSTKSCVDATHEASQEEIEETPALVNEGTSAPRSDSHKISDPSTHTPSYYDEVAAKVEAKYPLPEEVPATKPENPSNSSEKEKAPVKNSAKTPEKLDTSYLRYGKTKEQFDQEREEKKLLRMAKKALTQSGKNGGRKKKKKKR